LKYFYYYLFCALAQLRGIILKMAQFIIEPIQTVNISEMFQVSQVLYNRLIDINYNHMYQKVMVQDDINWFYIYSPDIPQLTIRNVFEALHIENIMINISWIENNDTTPLNLLDKFVFEAPLSQIKLYDVSLDDEDIYNIYHQQILSANENVTDDEDPINY
jgi:hypothetical protein